MNKNFRKISTLITIVLITLNSGCEKSEPQIPTSDRDKFLGLWEGTSSGTGGQRTFNMEITASNSSPDQILIRDFDLAGSNTFLPANVNGDDFNIVRTVIGGEVYEGAGSYTTSNTLVFSFTIDDGQGSPEARTGTAHR